MAFGYRYKLERQENGWWLVRFPGIPEALTEGETQEEARANAVDCVLLMATITDDFWTISRGD